MRSFSFSGIRWLPIREISPLCPGSKPSSRRSSLDWPFHEPRQTVPVTTDYVYVYVYVCAWTVCASALSFCFAKRLALYKSYPLLLIVNILLEMGVFPFLLNQIPQVMLAYALSCKTKLQLQYIDVNLPITRTHYLCFYFYFIFIFFFFFFPSVKLFLRITLFLYPSALKW